MSSTCPACGREVDPLRAGQVAFVGGKFIYFCDRDHKVAWLESMATAANDDVVTAEPPRVEPAIEAREEPPPEPAPAEDEPRSMPIRTWARREEAVPSMRTPKARTSEGAPRWTWAVAYAGLVSGALAVGVSLVGPSGDVARLPLALVAGVCALVYALAVTPRTVVRPPWTGAAAVAVGCACALAARATGSAALGSIASFAGVAAAAFIAVCMAMVRAAEPIWAARGAMTEALEVPAKTANEGGATSQTRGARDVRAGEQVIVSEGEVVPVDGVVSSGEAIVSPWLDAEADVPKREGSPVVAGARVLSGSLRVMATWTGDERAFAKLLVSSRSRAAPLVQLAALLDGRAVAPLGVLVGGIAFANGAKPIESIACGAAALAAFATPVASFAVALLHARGNLRALRHGIVHRDGKSFDRAGRAQIAVVCARGTVLLGEPEIVAIEAVGSNEAAAVLGLASAVATGSTHPFAAAILRAARARNVRPENVRNPLHAGSGATAIDAQGERIVLGRRAFLLGERVSVAVADELVTEHEAQGRSVLLVARGGKVVGLVALQDGLRAGARAAIQKLHDARMEPVLLSGEARETCEAIARALDIEHVRPEVDGPDRGGEVRALAEGGEIVAVLGHPSADDSALGAADVSVALDAAGASPGEWAVALASDDVRFAAEALTIPRAVRERSIRAMVVALGPGLLVSLALAFQLVPTWAAPLAAALTASIALLYAKE
ncbi:MAG TPA: HAD-IC family P-type ATPase [Polyangiaceae bacterium]|jgi:cation transport ATPase